MALRITTLLLLFLTPTGAKALDWEVVPGECVVTAATEFCKTEVMVSINPPVQHFPCLLINGNRAGCFSAIRSTLKFNIRIDANVEFTVVNPRGEVLAEYTLPYKIIDSTPARRRVRLPWSVF